jgi:hypothetical protein
MMFKRMMILGAVASALAFAGCQNRGQQEQEGATGGSGVGQEDYRGTGGTDVRGGGTQPGGSMDNQGGQGGSGNVGGPVGDQGTPSPAPDGMNGTDDPALDEDSAVDDDTSGQGTEIR